MKNENNRGPGALQIAMARRLRRTEAGQSLIAAIIVLFLLLVLGAAFVALVGNNLRNARQTARRNAADFYSEAGIRFMDEQLTNSAEGADWRPVPACLGAVLPCSDTNISTQDPDYFWLKPNNDNGTPDNMNDDTGGYTRVTFGGDTAGSPGGRALIRVTYRPEPAPSTPTEDAAVRKLIRLEAIGRVGVITPGDPTTYNNTQAVNLRRELVAYKEIGITDYLRYFTNKDNKPTTATLGAANQVFDAPDTAGTAGGARSAVAPTIRDIESYYIGGGIRSNAPLTFYGVNRLVMNPLRGEGLQVSGLISLSNIPGNANAAVINAAAATKVGNPARVTLQTALAGAPAPIFPSTSQSFNTYSGMVRDNPAGSDTQGLTASTGDPVNTNLRSVPRAGAPLIDSESASGVTRYRALTRDAVPLPATDTGGVAVNPANAGANGWGENLYLANRNDTQRNYSSLTNAYSLRTDWLNPGAGKAAGFWKKDFVYAPPGITITFTPRYMVLARSGDQINSVNSFVDRYRFRRPDGSVMLTRSSTLRYTYSATDAALANPPSYSVGENVADDAKFAGYPARLNDDGIVGNADDNYYTSNYVIYAEGNVRVRGVAGGYDPESGKYFVRHITVVSGGTVYVDGNLLRDNVPAGDAAGALVKGQSSIALLAHDYVTVNPSQFLATKSGSQAYGEQQDTHAFSLSTNNPDYFFTMDRGPVDANNTPPSAITNYPQPTIYFRHGTSGIGGTADAEPTAGKATIVMGVNGSLTANPFNFNGRNYLELSSPDNRNPVYVDQTFSFQTPPQSISLLYGLGQTGFFPAASAPYLELGTPNLLNIKYDPSNPDTTLDYYASRIGIAPLDVRIEAIMYAQEGSFFIIPGPWLNPNPEDTYEAYIGPDESNPANPNLKRPEDTTPATTTENRRVYPAFPFYRQPQDIRITFYGAITENLPAEVGDQSAWMEKWGWVPRYQGATGLPTDATMYGSTTANGGTATTVHGPLSPTAPTLAGPGSQFPAGTFASAPDTGNGIVYEYDTRASAPYRQAGAAFLPIRPNPYRPQEPLPITPHLPVAPGLLYVGERPVQPL
jgi:hypothetical protein